MEQGGGNKLRVIAWAPWTVLALATLSLVFRPREIVPGWPFIDDAYYALSIASSIHEDLIPSVFPGELTNGFQPLFTFIESTIFFLPLDPIGHVRMALFLHWLIAIGTSIIIGLNVRDFLLKKLERTDLEDALPIAAFLTLGAPYLVLVWFNGLETAFLMFMLALVWSFLQRKRLETIASAVIFGVLLGLLILARIDAAVFVLILLLVLGATLVKRRFALLSALVAGIVVLPWLAFGLANFGSFMPISGSAQSDFVLDLTRVPYAIKALTVNLMPWIPPQWDFSTPVVEFLVLLIRIGLVVLVIFIVVSKSRPRSLAPSSASVAFFVALALSYALLLGYYMLTSFATWFYLRYLTPLLLFGILIASWALFLRVAPSLRTMLALILCAFTVNAIAQLWTYEGSQSMYHSQVKVATGLVGDKYAVAARQSGTLSFFLEKVVNLDGKVNPKALTFAGRESEYLDLLRVNFACDSESELAKTDLITNENWVVAQVADGITCLQRREMLLD